MNGDNFILQSFFLTIFIVFKRLRTKVRDTAIYYIRGEKVMLDRDLAMLYSIETKRLKEAVRRNIDRFPADFMFELTQSAFQNWRTQYDSSNSSNSLRTQIASLKKDIIGEESKRKSPKM